MAAFNFADNLNVSLLKHDNERAFDELYKKYYFLVYSIALSLTHIDEDAKDITLSVFSKIWQGRHELDVDKSFRDYVCSAARNTAISHLRSKGKEASLDADPDLEPAANQDISSALFYEELHNSISFILNEKECFVFFAHVERDLSFKEIGKILGISENAASSLYTRAREKLKSHLKNSNDPSEIKKESDGHGRD
jgi:RNA polymerase sigma factor (sigma-70 family)